MAEITASMVKELREQTGLGMMECKKALSEADGDLKKAEELLRIKSGAKASKAASRVASEGVVGVFVGSGGNIGAIVEVNCETDFVGKNDEFRAFVNGLAKLVAEENPADVDAVGRSTLGGQTVEATRQALVQKIGENLSIRRFARIASDNGKIASYVHGSKIGVLIEFSGDDQLGKDLAMHIAALKPLAGRIEELDPAIVEREKAVLADQARASGKPEGIIGKMVEGRLKKFYEEQVLLEQIYVRDGETRVSKVIENAAKEIGAPIEFGGFVRLELGEGVDRSEGED